MSEKRKKMETQRLVEIKIKNYIVGDLEELGRRYFNDDVKVTLKWSLISCEVWLAVGLEKAKIAAVLFSNNWFKIESSFKDKPGFNKALEMEFDAYNFRPIDYKELGLLRQQKK